MTTIQKPRLHYFDMLKGIAIFMVVMGHILTMCVRGLDRAAIFKFIGEIHMPLFFFISGWFCFRFDNAGAIKFPDIKKRAVQLLVPMVAVSSIWIYYFPHSCIQSPLVSTWDGLWLNEWKNGYWFTLVLFEIILLAAASAPFIFRFTKVATSLAATAVISSFLIWVAVGFGDSPAMSVLSFSLTASFYPAFMAGAIARKHSDSFGRLVSGSGCMTLSILAAGILLYYVCWYWEFPFIPQWGPMAARPLLHIALAIIAIGIVKPWSEKAFATGRTPGRMADMWRFIGSRSLAIYLLHYFFLFPMPGMRPLLESVGLGLVPLLVFSAFWAALVIAVTLCANYIISFSRPLALLLTGTMPASDKNGGRIKQESK